LREELEAEQAKMEACCRGFREQRTKLRQVGVGVSTPQLFEHQAELLPPEQTLLVSGAEPGQETPFALSQLADNTEGNQVVQVALVAETDQIARRIDLEDLKRLVGLGFPTA
jgi:hypothetical protein